jgi:hypothetical protein
MVLRLVSEFVAFFKFPGLGIYLAVSPMTSLSYVSGGHQMLVCAALIGNRYFNRGN